MEVKSISNEVAHYLYYRLVTETQGTISFVDANDFEKQKEMILRYYSDNRISINTVKIKVDEYIEEIKINELFKSIGGGSKESKTLEWCDQKKGNAYMFFLGYYCNQFPTPIIRDKEFYLLNNTHNFRTFKNLNENIKKYLDFYNRFSIEFEINTLAKGLIITTPITHELKYALSKYISNIFDESQKNKVKKWPIDKSEKHLEWATRELEKKFTYITAYPINNKESYIRYLESTIDLLYLFPEKRTNIVNSIRKSWSQKKFRDKNSDKKQYSFNLTQETKSQLKKLSDKRGLNQNELLEELINLEFKK